MFGLWDRAVGAVRRSRPGLVALCCLCLLCALVRSAKHTHRIALTHKARTKEQTLHMHRVLNQAHTALREHREDAHNPPQDAPVLRGDAVHDVVDLGKKGERESESVSVKKCLFDTI